MNAWMLMAPRVNFTDATGKCVSIMNVATFSFLSETHAERAGLYWIHKYRS